MNYITKFIDSVRFLEDFDKEHKDLKVDYEQYKKHIERNVYSNHQLNNFLNENLEAIAQSFLANSFVNPLNQCHSFSQQFFDNWMEQDIGKIAPVAITIGNVVYDGKDVYQVSQSSLKRTINEGFQPDKSLELHVWLTFPNMTILDLTIVPTLVAKGLAHPSDFDNKNYVIWRETDGEKLNYVPLLQDNQFMYKVDKIAGRE